MTALLQKITAHRSPLAIGIGLAVLTAGIATTNLGVLTGFGLIALGATWSLSYKRPLVIWVHLCVYLMLYGLFAGAVLSGSHLPDTPMWRVLLRLDFAASFLLMCCVCRDALPALVEEMSQDE